MNPFDRLRVHPEQATNEVRSASKDEKQSCSLDSLDIDFV